MYKIFKYDLHIKEKQALALPLNSRIIRVDDVDGLFYLWAMIDTNQEELENRFLEFYKTGQSIETDINSLVYIGFCRLFIMQELGLYVFEKVEPKAPYTT